LEVVVRGEELALATGLLHSPEQYDPDTSFNHERAGGLVYNDPSGRVKPDQDVAVFQSVHRVEPNSTK
jgi:hypothetical protein